MEFNTVQEAIYAVKTKKPVLVVDDVDSDNIGSLVFAAESITIDNIDFLRKHSVGLIHVVAEKPLFQALNIKANYESTQSYQTSETISVKSGDAKENDTLSILKTIQKLTEMDVTQDYQSPGFIYPMLARKGGVLKRAGHQETRLLRQNLFCRAYAHNCRLFADTLCAPHTFHSK